MYWALNYENFNKCKFGENENIAIQNKERGSGKARDMMIEYDMLWGTLNKYFWKMPGELDPPLDGL